MFSPSNSLKCPYCRASLPEVAEVCQYCSRDIGRLIRAELQIKELEGQIAKRENNQEELKPAREPENTWATRLPIWLFYIISIIFVIIFANDMKPLVYLLPLFALFAGAITMYFGKIHNLWVIFIKGFAMPLILAVLYPIYLLFTDQSGQAGDDLVNYVTSLFLFSTLMGAITSIGALITGLIASVFDKFKLKSEHFSPAITFDWLSRAESGLDRIEKLFLKVVAIMTLIIQLISLAKNI